MYYTYYLLVNGKFGYDQLLLNVLEPLKVGKTRTAKRSVLFKIK